jgi:hypothetical protein
MVKTWWWRFEGVGGAYCGRRERHICRLKPPWWDHFFTSEPEKYKTKTPTSFEGWGFYIGLLQLSYCFSSSWLLSPLHFLTSSVQLLNLPTSTSKLPHFLTSFLLEFGFLDLNFLGLLRLKVPHYEDLQPQQVWFSWISQYLSSDKVGWNSVVQDSLY